VLPSRDSRFENAALARGYRIGSDSMGLKPTVVGLLIVASYLPRLFVRFESPTGRAGCGELSAHLLDLRCLTVETCSELRNRRLEVFLLLSHC